MSKPSEPKAVLSLLGAGSNGSAPHQSSVLRLLSMFERSVFRSMERRARTRLGTARPAFAKYEQLDVSMFLFNSAGSDEGDEQVPADLLCLEDR